MRFKVLLTEDAERDLEDIYTYVAEHDCRQKADYVLDRLLEVTDSLATSPERGLLPRELAALGIQEYRQVFFKPYRVIYRQVDQQVIIYVIADGRRDMQSLLARRVLMA
jgi:toxin ParE1/3/4